MNRDEAQRIAASVNMLRPEWPVSSLMTALGSEKLRTRPWRDVLIALTWVAADEKSHTPGRVLEAGPWWNATRAESATVSAVTNTCPEHPHRKAWQCEDCESTVGDPAAGLALVKATLREVRS